MSEEEQEALEVLKEIQENCRYKTYIENEERSEWVREYNSIETIFNLIDRLLRENNKYIEEDNHVTIIETQYFKDKYISKDKIRNKIKEIEYIKQFTLNVQPSEKGYEYCLNILKELLEE